MLIDIYQYQITCLTKADVVLVQYRLTYMQFIRLNMEDLGPWTKWNTPIGLAVVIANNAELATD